MPYSVINSHPDCSGYAVVKDSTNEVMGCHRTEKQAKAQLTALNIAEYADRQLPKNYRPASSADVPDGRNCGNCLYNEDGYCTLWDANIRANYYCNRWASDQNKEQREDSFSPNAAMKAEARKGLAWRREYGRGGTLVGVARARDIANGKDLPLRTVLRMRSFFARHEVDKEAEGFRPGEDGYPSNGRIAWALWGGDAGKRWADAIAARQNDRTAKALKILKLLRKIG